MLEQRPQLHLALLRVSEGKPNRGCNGGTPQGVWASSVYTGLILQTGLRSMLQCNWTKAVEILSVRHTASKFDSSCFFFFFYPNAQTNKGHSTPWTYATLL